MANAMKTYLKHMHKKFGYRAAWEPNRQATVGVYGKIHKGVFSPYGTLEKLGINVEIQTKETNNVLEYTSEGSTQITTKLKGETAAAFEGLLDADAGFAVEFGKEDSIVFKAKGIISHELVNKAEVQAAIKDIRSKDKNKWSRKYVIVTEVLEAKGATILISNNSNSRIELKVNGDVNATQIDIADASLGFEIVKNRGIGIKVIANDGLTPLYRLSQMKKKLWGGIGDLGSKNLEGGEDAFEDLPLDENEFDQD